MGFKIKKKPVVPCGRILKTEEAKFSIYSLTHAADFYDQDNWELRIPNGFEMNGSWIDIINNADVSVQNDYDYDYFSIQIPIVETVERFKKRRKNYRKKLAEYKQWCVDFKPLIDQELEDQKVRDEIERCTKVIRLKEQKAKIEHQIEALS